MSDKQIMNAIICNEVNGNKKFMRYHNVTAIRFLSFAETLPGKKTVNFYEKKTKKFIKQVKI
jgi:hypothetical protein